MLGLTRALPRFVPAKSKMFHTSFSRPHQKVLHSFGRGPSNSGQEFSWIKQVNILTDLLFQITFHS